MIAQTPREDRLGEAQPERDMSQAPLCPAGGATAKTIVGGDCRDDSGNFEIASGISSSIPALTATLVQPSDAGVNETQLPLVHDVFRFVTDGNGEPKVIGAGGQASVILAEHISGRFPVALKRSASPKDPRSDREKELTARLQAEGFVSLIGYYRDADGHTYIAMRYIEGATLKQLFEGFFRTADSLGPAADRASLQQFESCLRKLIDVMSSVHIMHEAGLIHRDLKPGNILVCRRSGKPVLLDLGLATAWNDVPVEQVIGLDAQTQIQANITGAGQVLGTLSYMPPESAGRYQAIDQYTPQTDIYSLGAVLFHLATGRCQVPEFPENMNPFEYQSQLENRLERIRRGSVESLDLYPFIPRPRELQAIILKAMQTDPAERYRSVNDMSADLEAWWRGAPVPVYRDGLSSTSQGLYDLSHWLRDRPRLLGGGVVAGAIAAVIAPLSALWYAERQKFEAQAAVVAAAADSQTADVLAQCVDTLEQILGHKADDLNSYSRLHIGELLEGIPAEIIDEQYERIRSTLLAAKHGLEEVARGGRKFRANEGVEGTLENVEERLRDIETAELQLEGARKARAEGLKIFRQLSASYDRVKDVEGFPLGEMFWGSSSEELCGVLAQQLPIFATSHVRAGKGEVQLPMVGVDNSGNPTTFIQQIEDMSAQLDRRVYEGSLSDQERQYVKDVVAECLLRVVCMLRVRDDGACSASAREQVEAARQYVQSAQQLGGDRLGGYRVAQMNWRLSQVDGKGVPLNGPGHKRIEEYVIGAFQDRSREEADMLVNHRDPVINVHDTLALIFELIGRGHNLAALDLLRTLPETERFLHLIAEAAARRGIARGCNMDDPDEVRVFYGASVAITGLLARSVEVQRGRQPSNPEFEAKLLAALATSYAELAAYSEPEGLRASLIDKADDAFRQALATAKNSQTLRLYIVYLSDQQRHDDALKALDELLKIDSERLGDVCSFRALIYADMKRYDQASQSVKQLLDIPDDSLVIPTRVYRTAALALATVLQDSKRNDVRSDEKFSKECLEHLKLCLKRVLERERNFPSSYDRVRLSGEFVPFWDEPFVQEYEDELKELHGR